MGNKDLKSSNKGYTIIILILIIAVAAVIFFIVHNNKNDIKSQVFSAANYEELMNEISIELHGTDEIYYLGYAIMYNAVKEGAASGMVGGDAEEAMYESIYGRRVQDLINEGKDLMRKNDVTIDEFKKQIEENEKDESVSNAKQNTTPTNSSTNSSTNQANNKNQTSSSQTEKPQSNTANKNNSTEKKEETSSKPEKSNTTSSVSVGNRNALTRAKEYLNVMAFSKEGTFTITYFALVLFENKFDANEGREIKNIKRKLKIFIFYTPQFF